MKSKLFKRPFIISVSMLIIAIFAVGLYVYAENNRQRFCFYSHLSDAVNVNNARSAYYSKMTNDISEKISDQLVKKERMMMPAALWIDVRAQKYIEQGMPIVCNDFIEMSEIEDKEKRPARMNVAENSVFEDLSSNFERAKKELQRANRQNDFKKVGNVAYELLMDLEKIENNTNSSFCMARHVVDSLGLAAVHAEKYSEESAGEINGLAQSFLKAQISGISHSIIELDKSAQEAHKLGVGIICNDVPKIPFQEEYENSL